MAATFEQSLPASFHRIVRRWFIDRFQAPSEPQRLAWPVIATGEDVLVAAPTGSGKTLTAFLVCLDRLLREALAGELPDAPRVLYISPLKALSNDIEKNLSTPLSELHAAARAEGWELPEIRVAVRTGDTPSYLRQKMLKKPPHIIVTTPESLFLMLAGEKSRKLLKSVDTVIVDEIHAIARDKRGSHLTLSLARLDELCEKRPARIGLSATQKPLDQIAAFLCGVSPIAPLAAGASCEVSLRGDAAEDVPDDAAEDSAIWTREDDDESDAHCAVIAPKPRPVHPAPPHAQRPCHIVDVGHRRRLDLGLALPERELSAICSTDHWTQIHALLLQLIAEHKSTLIFVNTRKLAERVAWNLGQVLGEEHIASHHGSLSRDIRLSAEERLKDGRLKAIVATASLELGIDVGHIDLVCQIGSPRSIATFLQRVGRAGHMLSATPKGRLIPLTRDELLECLALLDAIRRGSLDAVVVPEAPLDILAQQMIAAASNGELAEDQLYDMMRAAYPYRNLARPDFDELLAMLESGFAPDRRKSAYVHRDRQKGTLRARAGAKLAVVTSGGAIPEMGDFRVINEEDDSFVGTVNEDFAIDSSVGDIFLLGSTSWQFLGLRGSEVRVRDAHGAPPSLPFWAGEAPGRTRELSEAVAQLREELASRIDAEAAAQACGEATLDALRHVPIPAYQEARDWLASQLGTDDWTSLQAVHYVAAQKAALGLVPDAKNVVYERFFDASGGMQLVIHAPFGMRINKGFGLALRKRFCRTFDFELQASADDDGVVLSLGPQHSFPIESLFKMLNARNVRGLIEQALLQVPLFQIRFRWNATRALAVLRNHGGKRVPPALQRFRADDLMTAIFPQQTACKEHVVGDIAIPDHPLCRQTVTDCLFEAIDLDGLCDVLRQIEQGAIKLIPRDTREPSPFAYELLNAAPYAFLDGAPLEERRARAVALRSGLALSDVKDLATLDPQAILQVREEAWPDCRDAYELHDALVTAGVIPCEEGRVLWQGYFDSLAASQRAFAFTARGASLWAPFDLWPLLRAAYQDDATIDWPTPPALPSDLLISIEAEAAAQKLVRGYLEIKGVVKAEHIVKALGLSSYLVDTALLTLESAGSILRGRFSGDAVRDGVDEWCERRLLVRIHKLTLEGLRNRIRPVSPQDYVAFLTSYQHATPASRLSGKDGVLTVIRQLAGLDVPAGSWESEILATRVSDYRPSMLDELTHSGVVAFGRLTPPPQTAAGAESEGAPTVDAVPTRAAVGMSRVAPLALFLREDMDWIIPEDHQQEDVVASLRDNTRRIYDALAKGGALFPHELRNRTGALPTELDEALGELCRLGLAHADGYAAIRPYVARNAKRTAQQQQGLAARHAAQTTYAQGGRWALFPPPKFVPSPKAESAVHKAASGGSHAGEREMQNIARIERWAHLLLGRYGVLFRDVLARETAAPSWPELRAVLRRMEARGEVRGGRFIAGFGEQYAAPEAVDRLRRLDDDGLRELWVVIAAGDPLNLAGIVDTKSRIAPTRQACLAYRGGLLAAVREGTELRLEQEIDPRLVEALRQAMTLSGVFRAPALAELTRIALEKTFVPSLANLPTKPATEQVPSAAPAPSSSSTTAWALARKPVKISRSSRKTKSSKTWSS